MSPTISYAPRVRLNALSFPKSISVSHKEPTHPQNEQQLARLPVIIALLYTLCPSQDLFCLTV